LEILNTGEDNVVALTVDIPKQDNIIVKGPNRNIIGDLDANDDTTFKYEAMPKDGEISLEIAYTDSINERRHMTKKIYYDSSYFSQRKLTKFSRNRYTSYLFYGLLVLIILVGLGVVEEEEKERKRKKRERETGK